ncbi:MAG: ATP-binding cassette domain-containing protein [Hyphomicrobiaceae bacterium]
MLRIENLTIPGLPPLSFEVPSGQCLAVIGPSGTGKTRLLRAIADLDPAEGQVFLDGAERAEMPGWQWRRLVRYAGAEPAWWTDTPRSAFPAEPTVLKRAEKLAADLGLPEDALDRAVAHLSTGERQRLALVRALADQPRVLLLDEPTGALDTQTAALAEELIRYQALAGRSVILVSHAPEQVERLATARLVLKPVPAEPVLAPRQSAPAATSAARRL